MPASPGSPQHRGAATPGPRSKEVAQRSVRGARRPADRRDGSVTILKCSMNIACGSTYWSLRCRGTSACSNSGRQEMQAGEEEFEISPSAASSRDSGRRDRRAVREGTGLPALVLSPVDEARVSLSRVLTWFSPVLDSWP